MGGAARGISNGGAARGISNGGGKGDLQWGVRQGGSPMGAARGMMEQWLAARGSSKRGGGGQGRSFEGEKLWKRGAC